MQAVPARLALVRPRVMTDAPLTGPPRLTSSFSCYLDLLRGLSATWVALSHLELFGILRDGAVPLLPHNAHDAVVVFFVLSGFLVAYAAVARSNQGLQGFALDRASRILSVAVPVLGLSFAAALAGWITAEPAYQVHHWYLYFPMFLSFLNQSWALREIPFNLYPWWSLPFEVQYYAVFGCALFLTGKIRWIATALLFVLMGPRLWLLFPVWLCGAALLVVLHHALSRPVALGCAVVPVLLYAGIKIFAVDAALHYWTLIPWGYQGHARPFGNASYFLADYLTGPLVAVHLYGMAHVLTRFPAWLVPPVRRFAGVSFTLYLLHPLVYRILTDSFHLRDGGIGAGAAALGITLAATFAIAPATEYRRKAWRRGLAWLLARGTGGRA